MDELVICRHRPGANEGLTTVLTIGQDGIVAGTDTNLPLVLGYSCDEIEGLRLHDIIASAEDNPLCPDYASYHESGRPLTVTLRHGRGYFMAARVLVRSQRSGPPRPGPSTSANAVVTPKAQTTPPPESGGAQKAAAGRNDIAATRALLTHIRECLTKGGLPLEYQSIQPLQNRDGGLRIEILARLWSQSGPDTDPMIPADFLPLSERFELSRRLDRQVIRQVLCHLHRHRELGQSLRYCGFNLSRGSIQDHGFPEFVDRLLKKTGLDPNMFCFEIPAQHAVKLGTESRHTCRMLRQIGCQTALDGAGMSMESYRLAGRLPVDYIKLAPALMKELHDEPTHQVMIEALQRIANSSGKITIATSVENDIARGRAQSLGVHFAQGRLIGPPRALRELGKDNWSLRSAGATA